MSLTLIRSMLSLSSKRLIFLNLKLINLLMTPYLILYLDLILKILNLNSAHTTMYSNARSYINFDDFNVSRKCTAGFIKSEYTSLKSLNLIPHYEARYLVVLPSVIYFIYKLQPSTIDVPVIYLAFAQKLKLLNKIKFTDRVKKIRIKAILEPDEYISLFRRSNRYKIDSESLYCFE
jgi:hypothetical protein